MSNGIAFGANLTLVSSGVQFQQSPFRSPITAQEKGSSKVRGPKSVFLKSRSPDF